MIFNWISNGFTLVFYWNFNCIFNEFQFLFHWKFNLIYNGFPFRFHWNFNLIFIEVSIGFPLDFHWRFIEIWTGIHWNDNWISICISLLFLLNFKCPFEFQLNYQFPISNLCILSMKKPIRAQSCLLRESVNYTYAFCQWQICKMLKLDFQWVSFGI